MSKHLLCRCLFRVLNFCIERAPQIFISHLFIVGVYLFFSISLQLLLWQQEQVESMACLLKDPLSLHMVLSVKIQTSCSRHLKGKALGMLLQKLGVEAH